MLLGLAFENVLKGFISLVRLETRQTPPLQSVSSTGWNCWQAGMSARNSPSPTMS
jgi:hypothetical protein